MKKLLIKIIITIMVTAGLIIFIGLAFAAEKTQTPPTEKEPPAVKENAPADITKIDAGEKGLQNLEKKFYYDSKGKADPMYMPWQIEATGSSPSTPGSKGNIEVVTSLPESIETQVKGIVWSSHDPLALIGDKIVREGDEVAHAKVVKINKGEIIFLYSGKMFPIKISG